MLQIRYVPDPILRAVCDPVTTFDTALATLGQDMLATMYAAPGRGLAGPQVGVTRRIFVMDAAWKTGTPEPAIFVNPRLIAASSDTATLAEGCLSIPDDTTDVTRSAQITVGWQDVTGVAQQATFSGFEAACIQHEMDHLDGILITDKGAD